MPERWLPQMQAALEQEIGPEVLVTVLPLRPEEQAQAPVMFDNPRLVSPFEPLLRLFALPRYGAFDPTPLLCLFLPLFFGMILGDVAYGVILLALMGYLRQRFKHRLTLRCLTEVIIMGSAGVGAIAEKPEVTGTIILLVAIPETIIILGFAVAAMIILLLK